MCFLIDPKTAHDSRPKVSFRGTVIAGVYCVCARLAQKYVFVIAVVFFNSHDGRNRKFAKIGSSDVWARMTTVLRHGGALKQLIEASRMQAWLCIIPTLSQADVF